MPRPFLNYNFYSRCVSIATLSPNAIHAIVPDLSLKLSPNYNIKLL